ncbi:MAG TPA: hypothetical protein V6C82_08375 [Chroococcales cyanobacterium]
MRRGIFFAALLTVLSASPALAAPVTVSGQIWGDFSNNTGLNSARFYGRPMGLGYNAFNINRAYITTSARFDPQWSALLTADANANSGATTGQNYFLKYAYLQADSPLTGVDYVRMGLVPTPWYPFEAEYWRYGFQSLDIATKQLGMTTSAFGIMATGGANRFHYDLGLFDLPYAFDANNLPVRSSASYKLPVASSNDRKNIQARIGIDLAPGLSVSGLYSYYRPVGLERMDALVSLIGYKSENFTLVEEYATDWIKPSGGAEVNRRVWSAFGILGLGAFLDSLRPYDLVLRYDSVNPNAAVSKARYDEWITGIGYRPAKGVNLLLSDSLRTHEDGSPNENIVALNYGLFF